MTTGMQSRWVIKQLLVAVSGIAMLYGFALIFLMYMPRLGCCPFVLNH